MANDKSNSIWSYNPSIALAIAVAILYLIPTCILFWQTVIRYRSYFFLCVVFGSALEVGGYIARAVSTRQVDEIPPYAISSTLIILAPIFVAAGNYLLIGRLIRAVLDQNQHRILGIRAERITRTFVGCDIASFLIQASGSGIASSGNWQDNNAKIGTDVLIAGLCTQVLTFVFFLVIIWAFGKSAKQYTKPDAPKGWRKVLHVIYISSALILVCHI